MAKCKGIRLNYLRAKYEQAQTDLESAVRNLEHAQEQLGELHTRKVHAERALKAHLANKKDA